MKANTPYPGLRPFEKSEATIFFGRQTHVNEILESLKSNKFLAVLGSSGSGKSSLVKAGVIPSLAKGYMGELGTDWEIAEMRPGSDPFLNLAAALKHCASADGDKPMIDADIFAAKLRQSTYAIGRYFDMSQYGGKTRLLILVDQFEELFRYYKKESPNLAAAFVALIIEAAKHNNVYIIITMRSDFLGDAGSFYGLPEAINEGMYLTPRLTREQLNEAICLPALLYAGQVEPKLANDIINDASNSPDHLPLLQHALKRLWDRSEDKVLTFEEYRHAGGLSKILNDHLDEIYRSLSDEKQLIAKKMFALLAERDDQKYIRREVKVAEIKGVTCEDEPNIFSVIDVFRQEGHNFLMPTEKIPLHSDLTIDITHESLIRQWRRLKKWIYQESENARQYKVILDRSDRFARGAGELLTGRDLQYAKRWKKEFSPSVAWLIGIEKARLTVQIVFLKRVYLMIES